MASRGRKSPELRWRRRPMLWEALGLTGRANVSTG